MKVVIVEVASLRDGLLASGLMNILKIGGEMTAAGFHAELIKAGLSATIDTGQHLYLLKRDGLVRFGANEGYVLA